MSAGDRREKGMMEATVTPQLRKIARWLIDDSSTQAPQARSLLPSSNHPRRHQAACCGRPASEGRSTDGVEPLNFSIGRSIEGARAVVRMHGPRALIDRACPPPTGASTQMQKAPPASIDPINRTSGALACTPCGLLQVQIECPIDRAGRAAFGAGRVGIEAAAVLIKI